MLSSKGIGNLFKVKPIFISDAHGNNYTVGKAKGRKASMEVLVKGIVDTIENPQESIVFIGHADDAEAAEYLKKRIEEEVNPKEIYDGAIPSVNCNIMSTASPIVRRPFVLFFIYCFSVLPSTNSITI